ncbi:MAG: class I SAM-dependent methyltransferase [Bacteroidales bacterium]|nr:class I SAM-dependent methyltransferase [Bacteroidales bacterium]
MVSAFDDEQNSAGYDQQAKESGWYAPEVVFGLVFEFIKQKQSLLDLGIGSGMSAALFKDFGLKVYGLDGSPELLKLCRMKGISRDLKQHDLHELPLPYRDAFVDNVIAVGVLNFFRDIHKLTAEVSRVLKRNGIFAFTVEDHKPGMDRQYVINQKEGIDLNPYEDSIQMFRHDRNQIEDVLISDGFQLLKSLEFLGFSYPVQNDLSETETGEYEGSKNIYFKAYIARKL